MSEDLLLQRDGAITSIVLNRPEQGNTLPGSLLAQIESISNEFADDEDTRAVIFKARGDNFSYGAALNEMGSDGSKPSLLKVRRQAELGGRMMRAIQDIHQPTVCAIQGVSTGGATCIASACDFRIAADNARMGYGEVKLGINLMWHAVPYCVQLVGPSRAKQMIMSGRLIPAAILERWGCVDEVCTPEELEDRAREWAQGYVELPPIAVQMIKRSVNRIAGSMSEAIMHADTDQWLLGTLTEDFSEAIAAFREKRKPEFTGN